jgi:nitrosocyanin
MSMRLAVFAAAMVVASAPLVGCGGDKVVTLRVKDGPVSGGNAITPAKLTAHRGDTVAIKVTNTATDKPHGFTIDGYGVTRTIEAGKTETVSFKANKTGDFRVFCQLHPAHQPAQLSVT